MDIDDQDSTSGPDFAAFLKLKPAEATVEDALLALVEEHQAHNQSRDKHNREDRHQLSVSPKELSVETLLVRAWALDEIAYSLEGFIARIVQEAFKIASEQDRRHIARNLYWGTHLPIDEWLDNFPITVDFESGHFHSVRDAYPEFPRSEDELLRLAGPLRYWAHCTSCHATFEQVYMSMSEYRADTELYGWFQGNVADICKSCKKAKGTRAQGYVYLIQSPTKFYKIGRTKNPGNRMATFGVKLPFEVEYVCLIRSYDMNALESNLHEHFTEKRGQGEWFELDEEDVKYMKYLASFGLELNGFD